MLLSYYGDDFTGSADVMEALATRGISTVLFTRIPAETEFAPFSEYQSVGLAGASRSQTPEWMDTHLPQAFEWLKNRRARYCHYKVCSTFDSSPEIGNIGRAIEIGAGIFGQSFVPLVIGAPQLKRYTFAGHLFAGYQGRVYRIDRHPVMSRHPVTPMHESDTLLHLARQTAWPCTLANSDWPPTGIGLLDVHDAATQATAGQRLLEFAQSFVVGSSGVEYALLQALDTRGDIEGHAGFSPLPPVDRLVAVSGSVSPTTERQINHSLSRGFEGIELDPRSLLGSERQNTIGSTTARAVALLALGKSVLVYTAKGTPTDVSQEMAAFPDARQRIGEGLGQILDATISQSGVSRVVVAGGDTSSTVVSQLGIHALTTRYPLVETPGSPLCTAHSMTTARNGLEIAMKGGQVGDNDYFCRLRDGIG